MTSLLHALNIGTLAAWLSVAGFGTVGVLTSEWRWTPAGQASEEVETECLPPEIDLGAGQSDSLADPTETPEAPTLETLSEPPEIPAMPELAELAPLPELPDLPKPAVPTHAAIPEPSARPKTSNSPRPTARSSQKISGIGGGGGGTASGGSAGMSDGARLAAGRMPAPSYPPAARRAGQTGTVTVAFTVDRSGNVISAHAANPSPWPLLNEEAVQTVRRWKFPPGGIMKLQRPIVFRLR